MEDLEDEVDDIEDDIEDLDDEFRDFGEGIEGMEADVEAVATELVNLREEVKSTRSVFENGLQEVGNKIEGEIEHMGDEVTEVKNCTQALKKDTQYIKKEMANLETTVEGLRSVLETKVESLEGGLGEVKHYTLVHADHTEKDLGDMKEELTNLRNDLGAKVGSLEGELNTKHLEVQEELASLQRDMNSTLYVLQELKNQLIDRRQENSIAHQDLLPGSCSELHPNSRSGYYLLAGNSSEKVYCDMDRQSCGCSSRRGWMRVANIDMTDPNQQCPEGFRLRLATSKRTCETTRQTAGCTSIVLPNYSVQYSRVCGRVKAYQYGSPDSFAPYYNHRSYTIDDQYVDGVSITHGQSPRKHIWTFAAALYEIKSDKSTCPCTKTTTPYTGVVPPFIGNDYFCDTGSRQDWESILYSEDPLWDGEGCGPTSSCCQFNSPPWFCKELLQPTTDNVEVRGCRDFFRSDEEILFELINLYVQ